MDFNQKNNILLLAFKLFLENSPDMIFVKDIDLIYLAASDTFAKLTGNKCGEDLVGKTDFEIFDFTLANKYTNDDRSIITSGKNVVDYIEPLPEQDCKKRYSSTSKYIIYDDDGNAIGIYGIAKDVTDKIELEAEKERNKLSRQMFDNVLEADITENKILSVDGEWSSIFNISKDSLFYETLKSLANKFMPVNFVDEFMYCYDLDKLKSDYMAGIGEFSYNTQIYREDNKYRWVECRARIYHSRVSDTLRITIFFKDIDDEIQFKEKLQKKAETDSLTGLYNRVGAFEQISSCLLKNSEKEYAMLFIDLDNFKLVNDQWGHQYGDRVLQKVADKLKEIFIDDIIGRVGGDEFIVFIKEVPSRKIVEEKSKDVVNKLALYLCENDVEINVTCSVGVAFFKNNCESTLECLYEHADSAMYKAKNNGRNQVFFYDNIQEI